MVSIEHVELLIIGSGSGNSLVTPELADRRIGIVESGRFGGTCLNVGCIPTKMFSYAADVAESAAIASRFGVDLRLDGVRWADIRDRVFGRIDPISVAGQEYRQRGPHTTAYLGRARFTGPRQVCVTGADGAQTRVEADEIVVATGAAPHIPEVVRASGVPYYTSETIMRIERLPRRLLVLGAGYIALEFAHIFSALGVQVTVLARGPRVLRRMDEATAEHVTAMVRRRFEVRTDTTVCRFEEGAGQIVAALDDGTTCAADMLLVATGRTPASEDLDCEVAGIRRHDDGRIVVDNYGRTSAPGVWALGDVSSPHQLKHVANHEARIVAHNLAHPDQLRPVDHRFVPAAVFTSPQIACVGATREQLWEQGTPFVAFTQRYADVAYGWAMEDDEGICTVLVHAGTRQILGAHIVGHDAANLLAPLVLAISQGIPADEVARGQYWIHPALGEVVENALLGALERVDVDPADTP